MLQDIITRHRASMAADVHTELRAQCNRSCRVSMLGGNLVANHRTETSGVSARVYKNGVYGFSSMAELSDDAIDVVLREAEENARFMDRRVHRNTPMFPAIPGGFRPLDAEIANPEQKIYIDFVRQIDSYIADKYKNLTSRVVTATADSMEKLMITSDGTDGHTVLPRSYLYVVLNTETANGTPVELFDAIGKTGAFTQNFQNPCDLYEEIDALYEKLMLKREGVYADAGEKVCILNGMLTGMLAHEAVGHTVEADLVLGGSVAAGALGKQVASDKVSLVDFAHTAYGQPTPIPVYLDDEGTPACDAEIIRNGILTGYMNSRETAQRFGMQPTGNARAYTFSDEPLIRMRNTAILPGADKLEDMIASVEDGYYLVNTTNGQADTTGEFMFGISMGYEIKNGKLGRALLDTTISGVAFEMLKTVDMVSDTMTWVSAGFCGKKQQMPVGMGGPDIRCRVTMGGR